MRSVLSFSPRVSAAVALLCVATAAPFCHAQSLHEEVRRVLAPLKLANAKIGVSIVDVTSGDTLADLNASELFIPASNMKVLTSGAALMTLGPSFEFKTEIIWLNDKLIIKGDGDPAFGDGEILEQSTPRMSPEQMFDVLADAVQKAGVTSIKEIVIDDRVFDREYVHPSWAKEHLRNWYCAQVSGVNVHTNTVNFFFQPSTVDHSPTVSIEPAAPWIEVENKCKTIAKGTARIGLDRVNETNRFLLTGELRVPASDKITINEPGLFCGQLLADRLLDHKISIGSLTRVEASSPQIRLIGNAERYSGGRVVAQITTKMSDALKRCNTDSYNLYAEAFCKRMGHEVTKEPGSWANGTAVTRMLLSEKLGPRFAAGTTLVDGSGMSRLNLVTPDTLTHWLKALARDPKFEPSFTQSLATLGEGTLKKRFRDVRLKNELRAKSGYISGVRCLSGYVIQRDTGRRIAFSILANNAEKDDEDHNVLKLQEGVVQAIDKYLSRPAARPAQGG